jgi:hypothetical protein
MTIAACYVSSEGVILGADSTSTKVTAQGARHYDYEQKLFEVGEAGSTLGLVTWGCSRLPSVSYRQLAAELSDDLIRNPPASVNDAVSRWNAMFWHRYSTDFAPLLQQFQLLGAVPNPTPQQVAAKTFIEMSATVGFCIGGHVNANRTPHAYTVIFRPSLTQVGPVTPVPRFTPSFWAVDWITQRLIKGIDKRAYDAVLASGRWQGVPGDLDAILTPYGLMSSDPLPLREAIDWIYSLIYITIKAMKFSVGAPVCGGSVEIAVITADRPFRWVCHKRLDQAISDHVHD